MIATLKNLPTLIQLFSLDELPLFTITSVVDDADLNVTHIMRGDDHLTNTAAQIQLFKMLDSKVPEFDISLIKSLQVRVFQKKGKRLYQST